MPALPAAPILSCYKAGNEDVFPLVLHLHVPLGSSIADVTAGRGVFWKNVDSTQYVVSLSDIKMGTDFRQLPYADESYDALVLDPPYIDGFYRPEAQGRFQLSDFDARYGRLPPDYTGPYYHEGVIQAYRDGGREAVRVLRPGGTLIVKTQDEVSNHRQELTHVQIINYYEQELGLYTKDLFVVVRQDVPHSRRIMKQVHAKKAHSYFLVFVKAKAPGRKRKAS